MIVGKRVVRMLLDDEQVAANEYYHDQPQIMRDLQEIARSRGLWNLFMTHDDRGAGLTNLEYAPLCEVMGRSHLAPEVFNCSAPDTGNMEILNLYATESVKAQWLAPLLAGEIRSAFSMTEPHTASSDAPHIGLSLARAGDEYVLNGRTWFASGAPARA